MVPPRFVLHVLELWRLAVIVAAPGRALWRARTRASCALPVKACGTATAKPPDMRNLLFATALTAALGTAAPNLVHAAPANVPAETATDVRRAEAKETQPADADETRYAQQESQNPETADFTGGNTVIFIGSTTAMVLAILLLLVIL